MQLWSTKQYFNNLHWLFCCLKSYTYNESKQNGYCQHCICLWDVLMCYYLFMCFIPPNICWQVSVTNILSYLTFSVFSWGLSFFFNLFVLLLANRINNISGNKYEWDTEWDTWLFQFQYSTENCCSSFFLIHW